MVQKKPVKQAVTELALTLLEKRMLQRFKMPKKALLPLIRDEGFAAALSALLPAKGRVSCAGVMAACRDTLDRISPEPEGGWLKFAYRYAQGLQYPVGDSPSSAGDGALFFLAALQVVLDNERQNTAFDPLTDFAFLTPDEFEKCGRAEEYARFLFCWRFDFVYEMMRLGCEVTQFHTLEHIAGVHHVAMCVSRALASAGEEIDLALISGAAAGHDIGKFGCKPNERVPYLHYYYTDRWFTERQMPGIGHIAANHSTWDLELENLSAESLALIYSDFRVKQSRSDNGGELTRIYSLEQSFDVILSKLDNVDEIKKRRYRFVYSKLRDFEDYICRLGFDSGLSGKMNAPAPQKDIALMSPDEAVKALTMLAVSHNLTLMGRLGHERRFGNILEAARSEKNWKRIRAYINIFEEYFTYLGTGQKIQTLGYLYEMLMHREGDIRRQAAELIGNMIANFNVGYHKELPEGAVPDPGEQTPFSLWEQYIGMIIYPDHKLTAQHKSFIGYTLKIVAASVLRRCGKENARRFFGALLRYYERPDLLDDEAAFYLMDALLYLPLELSTEAELMMMCRFAERFMSGGSMQLSTAALRFLKLLSESFSPKAPYCLMAGRLTQALDCTGSITLTFLKSRILERLGLDNSAEKEALYSRDVVSDIFLDNLKIATPWILKAVNIELLVDQIERGIRDHILHISAHFSNLIKVSERVVVRHSAGRALIKIAPLLTLDQRNEIAVELTKGLEVGEYEFSKYIPEYLGELAMWLHPEELDELIGVLKQLLSSSNDRIVSVTLHTVGILLECYPEYEGRFDENSEAFEQRRKKLLGMLLKGLASYREAVRQESMLVTGKVLFASKRLSHAEKARLFSLAFKKILFLISESSNDELTFFYRAAALSHIYRFMAVQRLDCGPFSFERRDKIAFFPGTFDPFTLSHKGIVRAIRDLGFEVFLAVDEFSWSKKTQPHLIRRKIVSMSVADEFHVHLFPDDIPVNIANPDDLKRLGEVFSNQELYIAVGSDVVANASSYRAAPAPSSIHAMNHIVFRRESGVEGDSTSVDLSAITGKVIELQLPTHLEDISSTRIRENIDSNRDISNLIDPVVQEYIYHNSLYLREPQYKQTLRPQDIFFEYVFHPTAELLGELGETVLMDDPAAKPLLDAISALDDSLMLMRDTEHWRAPIGFIRCRQIGGSELLKVLGSAAQADHVRRSASGKILLIRGIYSRRGGKSYDFAQLLLTEVLAKALADDCSYAIFHAQKGEITPAIAETLSRQGFVPAPDDDGGAPLYTVDMRAPLVLIQNLETTIKEPFSSNEKVLSAIRHAHHRLQTTMTELYPGCLVLSLSSGVIHRRLVDKITALNGVPAAPVAPRVTGRYMCVPFGKILRGKVVPNTVTKTLHTDKVYEPDLSSSSIEAFPYYTSLQSQMRAIHSFGRPVILVDDLLHAGDRWQALSPIIRSEDVRVEAVLVGLLSGRGRDLLEMQSQTADCVYYLPNMRSWFVESTLYPFIGGDTVRRANMPVSGLLPSINMILPYAASKMPQGASRRAIFDFSRCCLENSRDILTVLETQYRELFARNLTLSRLSEAVILPLCPDKGSCLSYDPNLSASVYLENDIEMLDRMRGQMI